MPEPPDPDPVADLLRRLPMFDAQRGDLWDLFQKAATEDDLAAALTPLRLPNYVKAGLWSLKHQAVTAPAETPGPEGSALRRFVSNAGAVLNPITMATGLYESLKSPEATGQTVERIYRAGEAEAGKAADAYRQGRYTEMVGHGAAAALPILGPAAAAAGEQIASGDVAGGLGTGVGLVGSVVLPGAVKKPVAAARTAVAEAVRRQAVPLVRAGVKAPLTLLKQQAGASSAGANFGANRLAKFLIDNRITTPGQAARIIKNTEAELQQILATKGQMPTDAPQRALLYLDILEQQAAKALAPDHAATVRAAAAALVEGPLGETTPGLVPPRALRPDVPAAEALDIARATSRFETRRSWGEQKGTAMEATKAKERAVRDAFKVALPEARTPLERQGQAILAQKVLDRQVWREANRDVISLPGLVGLSANAVVGFAAHWFRNHQVRAGLWADDIAKAIATNNAPAAAGILSRLGVRLPPLGVLLESLRTAPAPAAVPATGSAAGPP